MYGNITHLLPYYTNNCVSKQVSLFKMPSFPSQLPKPISRQFRRKNRKNNSNSALNEYDQLEFNTTECVITNSSKNRLPTVSKKVSFWLNGDENKTDPLPSSPILMPTREFRAISTTSLQQFPQIPTTYGSHYKTLSDTGKNLNEIRKNARVKRDVPNVRNHKRRCKMFPSLQSARSESNLVSSGKLRSQHASMSNLFNMGRYGSNTNLNVTGFNVT